MVGIGVDGWFSQFDFADYCFVTLDCVILFLRVLGLRWTLGFHVEIWFVVADLGCLPCLFVGCFIRFVC